MTKINKKNCQFKVTAYTPLALSIQIAKFKIQQYQLRAILPNLILAKITRYTALSQVEKMQILSVYGHIIWHSWVESTQWIIHHLGLEWISEQSLSKHLAMPLSNPEPLHKSSYYGDYLGQNTCLPRHLI